MKTTDLQSFENPYFDEVAGGIVVGSDRADFSDRHREVVERRDDLVREYAWGIPNGEAVRTLARYGPILEVGAGKGYWSMCILAAGGDAIATDADPFRFGDGTWTDVVGMGAVDAIDEFGEGRTLFICWPPKQDWVAEALRSFDGEYVAYVGEGRTGVTAPPGFHRALFEGYHLVDVRPIPRYVVCRDRLELWQRD